MSGLLQRIIIIVPTVLYIAEAWGMIIAERKKVSALVKCLRSFVLSSRMDRVRNEWKAQLHM